MCFKISLTGILKNGKIIHIRKVSIFVERKGSVFMELVKAFFDMFETSLEGNFGVSVFLGLVLILLPLIIFLGYLIYYFFKKIINKKYQAMSFNSKLIFFTIALTISMLSIQFLSESYAQVVNEEADKTVLEILASSFLHTLKGFGADDNFLNGAESFKRLISAVFPEYAVEKSTFGFSIIVSLMAIVAPITSATIFFEILTNFFPKLKLFFSKAFFWKEKYFFSELNERSLTLAKSVKSAKRRSPIIVFTNVNDSTYENAEYYRIEAKRIGAICFHENLSDVKKRFLTKKKIILINDNEVENLELLTEHSVSSVYKTLKRTEIYLFCQDCIYADIERQFRKNITQKYKSYEKLEKIHSYIKAKYKDEAPSFFIKLKRIYIYFNTETKHKNTSFNEDLDGIYKWCHYILDILYQPVVIPVRHYRNLITNMLETTPLYEPIVHKEKKNRTLNVTILGIGDIGTEMFLTTYWIGQMLDCKLCINVVSKEPKGTFEDKLNYINPEILRTTNKDDEILRVYKDKDVFSEPYCEYKYFSCDVKSEEFKKLLKNVTGIADTNYFLVSLGSDEENLSIANMLKTEIGVAHIANKAVGKNIEKTIINYVVYNPSLNKSLGEGSLICSCSADEPDIYMQAVGGIENLYCEEYIFMKNYLSGANAAAKSYDKKQGVKVRRTDFNKRLKDEYQYWSNLALRLHFKYKVFSVGFITKSIFDEGYERNLQDACQKYIDEFRPELKLQLEEIQRNPTLIERKLQWLEHRRWCAFLRTMGFRQTQNFEAYILKTASHKNPEMKLHPCLVECEKPVCKECMKTICENCREAPDYMHKFAVKKASEKDKPDATIRDIEVKCAINGDFEYNNSNYDLLDELSVDLIALKQNEPYKGLKAFSPYDFKQYDYPNSDYLDEV